TARPNLPSAFGTLSASAVTANLATGQTVPATFGSTSEVVLVGAQSLVKPQINTNGNLNIVLYGPSGKAYQIQSSSSPTGVGGSSPVTTSGTMATNLNQTLTNVSSSSTVKFFRA